MILGKVQITLVWNSRNENSPGSDKLNALANVSLLLPFFFLLLQVPCLFPFNIRNWWSRWLIQFLWKNGGPRSRVHLIHSVWANFQTSTNNVSLTYSYKTNKRFICH